MRVQSLNLLRFASNFLENENLATRIKFKAKGTSEAKESLKSCKVTPYPSLTWAIFLGCDRLNCFTALVTFRLCFQADIGIYT